MCARGKNEHSQTEGEYDDPRLSAEHARLKRTVEKIGRATLRFVRWIQDAKRPA